MKEKETTHIHILTVDAKTLRAAQSNPTMMAMLTQFVSFFREEETTKRNDGFYFKAIETH